MANTKKNKKIFTDEEIFEEIKKLSDKAKENSSHQLDLLAGVVLGDEDIDTNFSDSTLKGTADPEKAHRLYYTMRRAMMDNLPSGKKNSKLRNYIYSEKSLFLNRGQDKDERGFRGSDERMTYIDNYLQKAFSLVTNWIKEGANPFDLYIAFWNLNEEKGYHKPKSENTQTSLNLLLTGLLHTPPMPKVKNKKK